MGKGGMLFFEQVLNKLGSWAHGEKKLEYI